MTDKDHRASIAFVAPFFGAKASGGAESECRNTAIRLAARGIDVHILTTTVQDLHHDWNADSYLPGDYEEDGLTVHRFSTNRVLLDPFRPYNCRLISGHQLTPDQEKQFMALHINSFDMLRHIEANRDKYKWICFIPYLFGTTFFGSKLCPDNAILIPCLHDEGYARMEIMKDMFAGFAKIVFHAGAEKRLAERFYGELNGRGLVIGEGVKLDFESDGQRFKDKYGIEKDFLLYAGRKDETKNVHTLVRYFADFKRHSNRDLELIMIGPESIDIPEDMSDCIRDLGFVPVQDKYDAYSGALALCQPSLNESFSIVMMEGWSRGRPCLVHSGCAVTRDHVVNSGGGLHFGNYAEFSKTLDYLLDNGEMTDRMGAAGKHYAISHYDWDRIIDRFVEEVFELNND